MIKKFSDYLLSNLKESVFYDEFVTDLTDYDIPKLKTGKYKLGNKESWKKVDGGYEMEISEDDTDKMTHTITVSATLSTSYSVYNRIRDPKKTAVNGSVEIKIFNKLKNKTKFIRIPFKTITGEHKYDEVKNLEKKLQKLLASLIDNDSAVINYI